ENPWDSSIIHSIIRSWVHSLSSESAFSPDNIPPKVVTADPKCSFAPAIILRKRTQRGWITAFDNIITRLKLEKNIPNNIKLLVNISDSINGSTRRQTDTSLLEQNTYTKKIEDSHVYFPLPTNDEQLKIIQKLHSSNGVRVQGPPGTGKSHTIANIICHYLATDKKVLVTAYAPRALKVLQDKIPQELLALCVSVLGHDTQSMENLQRAVNEITEKFNDWNEERNNQNIHELQKELNQYKEESAIIKKKLRELKEKDTYKFCDIVGYEGTVQEIAKLIKANEENFGWIPDRVEFGTTAPLSNLEFKKLLYLLRDIEKSEEKELTLHRIKSNEVDDPDLMRNLFNDEKNVKEELNAYQHYS
ncbi:MAG: AAA domain-containing protein, partial [Nitrospinota bacterium]